MRRLFLAAAIAALPLTALAAQPKAPDDGPAAAAVGRPISKDDIERSTFAEWQDRKRQASEDGDAKDASETSAATPQEAEDGRPEDVAAPGAEGGEQADPFLIRLQVLLDRAHASPGVIDGVDGSNTEKAVRAYEEIAGLKADGAPDEAMWAALSADGAPAMMEYEITPEDLKARFAPDLPKDYGALAKLDWLGYRDAAEMLAERFHMDEALLRALNPDADFARAGQKLLVADTGEAPQTKVERIVIDKERGELFAYGEDDKLVLALPATIGSSRTPSPEGTMKVNGSAREPTYEYDPDKNFQQGDNSKPLTLPPGPNGPVGDVWIDLSKPTYGIHGTPEPSEIDKTASHGCVRLTNWDAQALSKLVRPQRTVVEFR